MSLYATISDSDESTKDRDGGDIATNSGWSDFIRWVGLLDGPDELNNLARYGWSDDAAQLIADIDASIANGSPTADQKSIAQGIKTIAETMVDGEILTISDGSGVADTIGAEVSA